VRTSPFNQLVPYNPLSTWPVVLLLHSAYPVLNKGDMFHRWNTTVDRVKALINHLDRHFEFIDEAALLELQENNWKGAEGKVLVTFDDGYAMVYTYLSEFFHQRRIRPLLFLTTGLLAKEIVPWYAKVARLFRRSENRVFKYNGMPFNIERLPERLELYAYIQDDALALPNDIFNNKLSKLLLQSGNIDENDIALDEDMEPLSRMQLLKLLDAGWALGSHGVSHYPMATLSPKQVESELSQSKAYIEALSCKPVSTLSYPNGSHNAIVRGIAKKYYRVAFIAAPERRLASQYRIPRMPCPDLEHELYRLGKIPRARLRLIEAYNRPHRATARGLNLGERVLCSLPPLLFDGTERRFLVNFIARRLKLPKVKQLRQRFVEVKGINLGTFRNDNQNNTNSEFAGSKRVVILCGPYFPERKAVAQLSRYCNIVGVVIHNFYGSPGNVIKSNLEGSPFSANHLTAPYVMPYFQPENGAQLRLLGPDSLAWFVASHTRVYSTPRINDPAVVQAVQALHADILLCFGTGLVKGELLSPGIPTFNLHWGLSPWFRGGPTERWPIYLDCARMIGVTIHRLSSKIDGGDIVAQERPKLDGAEDAREIEYKVSLVGIELFKKLIRLIECGREIVSEPQDLSKGKLYLGKDFTNRISNVVEQKLEDGFIYKGLRSRESAPIVMLNVKESPSGNEE